MAGALLQTVGEPTDLALTAAAALGGDIFEIRIDQIETGTEPPLPSIPRVVVALTIAGFAAACAGLAATVVAVGTPSILNPTAGASRMDLLGGLCCAAMWIIGALALRKRYARPLPA